MFLVFLPYLQQCCTKKTAFRLQFACISCISISLMPVLSKKVLKNYSEREIF